MVNFVPFYAYIIRTVVTRYVSCQFTHIYNLNTWLTLLHSMLTLSEEWNHVVIPPMQLQLSITNELRVPLLNMNYKFMYIY